MSLLSDNHNPHEDNDNWEEHDDQHNYQHGHGHAHVHGIVDPSIFAIERDTWIVRWSFVGRSITAIF
jgi:ABC-type nickel/cobalt efflux system permease component RcnA